MKIVLMAAISPDRVIGWKGAIPWHYPADMRHIKKTTTGHPCVMGRKTWESLPRRPLPGRPNLVLTRQADYKAAATRQADYKAAAGVIVCGSFEEARGRCKEMGAEQMFVLGGEEVFRETLAFADEMLITHVPDHVAGDVHFPKWDKGEWHLKEEWRDPPPVSPPSSKNLAMSMLTQQQEGLRFARYIRRRDRNRTERKETESDV